MKLFEKFDFTILDDANFKEDSVREEIIVPILTKLGYSASGENRIIRSKQLEHPFVQFGTKSKRVSIIPDYLIQINNDFKFVLDAKAPNEIITTGKNVEQVYSYAVHKEIRVNIYGLCNGRELIIFDIYKTNPILFIKISKIDENWIKVLNILRPLVLTKPYILTFKPDFGLHLIRLGFDTNVEFSFKSFWVNYLAKISNEKYSLTSYIPFKEQIYCASFDFDKNQFEKLLEIIPKEKKEKISLALSNYPFTYAIETKNDSINIGAVATLSPKFETGKSEAFIPLLITDFKKFI